MTGNCGRPGGHFALNQKREILSAFSPDCKKKDALAPNLQLLQLAKVNHENLTLKSILFEKISETKKIRDLKMTKKNSLRDSLKTLIQCRFQAHFPTKFNYEYNILLYRSNLGSFFNKIK